MKNEKDCERAVVQLVTTLGEYAKGYEKACNSKLGDDYYLSAGWQLIAAGTLTLLNGPTGSVDCGKLEHAIREAAKAAGIELA